MFSCSYCSCTIFILTSYSLYTQVLRHIVLCTLILILIDVQYLQNVVFSFEKGLNGQMPNALLLSRGLFKF